MYTLKDYAPYFERKEEFKRTLENIQRQVDKWILRIAIFICLIVLMF